MRMFPALRGSLLGFLLVGTAASVSLAQTRGGEKPRKPPKRAEQPFLVYVAIDASDAPSSGDVSAEEQAEQLEQARVELQKQLAKKKRWLRLAPAREDAEIVVELIGYSNRAERRYLSTWGVVPPTEGGQPDRTQHIEVIQHVTLRARASFLGAERSVAGSKSKSSAARAKDAAKDLANRLEQMCKEDYWKLVEQRRSTGL